jgi:hypothetical protein
MSQGLVSARVLGSGEWDRLSKAVEGVVKEMCRRRREHGEVPSARFGLMVLAPEVNILAFLVQSGQPRETIRQGAVRVAAGALGIILATCEPPEVGTTRGTAAPFAKAMGARDCADCADGQEQAAFAKATAPKAPAEQTGGKQR